MHWQFVAFAIRHWARTVTSSQAECKLLGLHPPLPLPSKGPDGADWCTPVPPLARWHFGMGKGLRLRTLSTSTSDTSSAGNTPQI